MTTAPTRSRAKRVLHFLSNVSPSPTSLSGCAPHPLVARPPARLPGAGASAERSLEPTAGIRDAAALALKAPPGSAASDRQARFREPRLPGPQGGRWRLRPWLWPRGSRGQGEPPASPAAPTAALRSPAHPYDSWLAPPRLWIASAERLELAQRQNSRGGFKGTGSPGRAGRRLTRPLTAHFSSRSSVPPNRT